MLIIIAISIFVCVSLGMLGVYWLLYRPQSAATERLRRLGGNDGMAIPNPQGAVVPDESPATDLAQRLANPLNKILPPSASEARKTQKLLMQAGYRIAYGQCTPIIHMVSPKRDRARTWRCRVRRRARH